jgi:hypothetical protein
MNLPKRFKEFMSLQKPTVDQEPDHLAMTKIKPSLITINFGAIRKNIPFNEQLSMPHTAQQQHEAIGSTNQKYANNLRSNFL